MVISKKCKICAALDVNNVSISGEYFGKLIPDLIMKICGIEIDSRKASGVLICQPCIIQLVLTDVVIDKLRKAVGRLKKTEKITKPKTPAKSSTVLTKNTVDVNSNITQENGQNEQKPKTPKKVTTLKSAFLDESKTDSTEDNSQNKDTPNTLNDGKFKKLLDNEMTTIKASKRLTLLTDVVEPTSVKRNKTMSVSLIEEIPMDLTIDEQDGEEQDGERTSIKEGKMKIINCIICGKVFNSKSTLRGHIETAHMGERLKACPHCSLEFRSQQKYESHVFSEKCKNNNHACQYPKCNKRFKTAHKMELHMQEKHTSQNHSGTE